MSTSLTPEQALALRVARLALAADRQSTKSDTHRVAALREALQMIADAFPEGGRVMTGPEHYREAENLMIQIDDGAADWEPIVAAAQVHATLALAAATALHGADPGGIAWLEATS